MKLFLIVFCSLSVFAVDSLHYFEIDLNHKENGMSISVNANPLFPYAYLRDDRYLLDEQSYDQNFDGPLRQVAFLMRTLERNRGVLMDAKNPTPLPILSFEFNLNVRDEPGAILQKNVYKVIVELDAKPNTCVIRCDQWGTRQEFPINRLTVPSVYQSFVQYLVMPKAEKTLPRPNRSSFVVDLFYRWPDVEVDESEAKIFDLFPSLLLWDKGIANRITRHVATAYSYKLDNQWQTESATHARVFGESVHAFTNVLESEKNQDPEDYIVTLEEYLNKVPSDKRALKRLMDSYLQEEQDIKAYGLISRYQPFFATIRGGLDNQEDLAEKAQEKRNFLLGSLSKFERDERAKVAITTPANGDLVTGTTQLEFTVAYDEAKLLLVEAFLGNERIARLTSSPFKLNFSVEDIQARSRDIRVVAYFENQTFQDHIINVKILNVDEQQRVNLVPLRASVLSLRDDVGGVKKELFQITENGKPMKLEHFRKSDAPLRVAFVVDTSGSMMGRKILATQFALKSFLEKLMPDDSASVYTFDDRVLKISEFTRDFTGLSRNLMSLTPKGSTTLYDAMLIAHDALLGENGTKVMIVISDGDDSGSATTDFHVVDTLRNSPVMVCSVILTGGELVTNADRAKQFLKEVSRMTGSLHTQVRNPKNLPETFDKIYADLRSFYYMDYYSDLPKSSKRKVEVRYKGKGRLRYRILRTD